MALRVRTSTALALPGVLLLALFFALPVVAIAVDALREGGSAFARVFATAGFWTALGGSTALTLVAAVLSSRSRCICRDSRRGGARYSRS
jgi:ABC-type Fe3+ transport system permease subunit